MTAEPMNPPETVETSAEQAWQHARALLLSKLGQTAFDLGVKPLRLFAADAETIRLVAPSTASATWIQAHHPGALEDALRAAGLPTQVDILGDGRSQGELFPPASGVARRARMRFGSLLPRYTFDTFVIGGSNQFAHAACKAVAMQPGNHYNPLFLYGGVGLGKTHLANAIGHEAMDRNPEVRIAYLSAETFMSHLIAALRRDRMEEFKGVFRRIDVLIIDDVQFLAARERTQDEFFHTFNALHEARKQIVLTSDKIPKDITGLEERLRNRFEWGLIADIQPPDMETRVAILQKKADLDGVDLPHDVAIFLASHIDSNVRELEGSLTKLQASASLSKTSITVEFARTVLRDLLRERRAITIEGIQAAVCDHYHIRLGDLLSKKRTRNIAVPRQVAMYLARKLTPASYPAIGERFGKDHSTAIHAHEQIGKRLVEDGNLRASVEQIERAVQGKA
ncbi:MAG TPA: chromosomal replication initiator protein DnaA [Candidatus Binatia bacterium]